MSATVMLWAITSTRFLAARADALLLRAFLLDSLPEGPGQGMHAVIPVQKVRLELAR